MLSLKDLGKKDAPAAAPAFVPRRRAPKVRAPLAVRRRVRIPAGANTAAPYVRRVHDKTRTIVRNLKKSGMSVLSKAVSALNRFFNGRDNSDMVSVTCLVWKTKTRGRTLHFNLPADVVLWLPFGSDIGIEDGLYEALVSVIIHLHPDLYSIFYGMYPVDFMKITKKTLIPKQTHAMRDERVADGLAPLPQHKHIHRGEGSGAHDCLPRALVLHLKPS